MLHQHYPSMEKGFTHAQDARTSRMLLFTDGASTNRAHLVLPSSVNTIAKRTLYSFLHIICHFNYPAVCSFWPLRKHILYSCLIFKTYLGSSLDLSAWQGKVKAGSEDITGVNKNLKRGIWQQCSFLDTTNEIEKQI